MKNPFWSRFVNACIWSIKWEHQNFIRANKVKCIGSIGKVGKNYTKLSQICVTIKWYCGFINFRRKAKKFIQICLYVILRKALLCSFLMSQKNKTSTGFQSSNHHQAQPCKEQKSVLNKTLSKPWVFQITIFSSYEPVTSSYQSWGLFW